MLKDMSLPLESQNATSSLRFFSPFHLIISQPLPLSLSFNLIATIMLVVATLVVTIAFTSSTAVPGGLEEATGCLLLRVERAFDLFSITSLVAFCFSIIATIMFLLILSSRYQEFDFNSNLAQKLILGMSSLFMSIASMLVSFCAGHFFVLKAKFQNVALPIYLLTSFPVRLFALAQFPLYFDLLKTTLRKVPQRSYKATPVMEHDSETKDKKNEAAGKEKGPHKSFESTSTGGKEERDIIMEK